MFAVLVSDCFFFFKQKTAYEMRISDWSSDVCSSDLHAQGEAALARLRPVDAGHTVQQLLNRKVHRGASALAALQFRDVEQGVQQAPGRVARLAQIADDGTHLADVRRAFQRSDEQLDGMQRLPQVVARGGRSEEHTSELQSLMRISY